jgi:hypothetical protein
VADLKEQLGSGHPQVLAMLRDALAQAEHRGAIGVEIVLTTADGVSSYRHAGRTGGLDCADAAAAMFDSAPCDGGTY